MSKLVKDDSWVWVLVQEPGVNEQLLGQHDEENDVWFVPTFSEKEEALKCYNQLALDKTLKYETQAVLYEELLRSTSENGFMIFILDGSGKILEKISP